MYSANKRAGCAATKTRAYVRGGGKKPWRQKGTGRARVSSIRNPIWRGGGVAFGPQPRDYSYSMPDKTKKLAIKSGLNSKLADEKLRIVEKIELKEPKTKLFKSILKSLKIKKSALLVLDKVTDDIKKASRNIPKVTVTNTESLNAMDILRHEELVITEAALRKLQKRI